jgi:hypothetical protein
LGGVGLEVRPSPRLSRCLVRTGFYLRCGNREPRLPLTVTGRFALEPPAWLLQNASSAWLPTWQHIPATYPPVFAADLREHLWAVLSRRFSGGGGLRVEEGGQGDAGPVPSPNPPFAPWGARNAP